MSGFIDRERERIMSQYRNVSIGIDDKGDTVMLDKGNRETVMNEMPKRIWASEHSSPTIYDGWHTSPRPRPREQPYDVERVGTRTEYYRADTVPDPDLVRELIEVVDPLENAMLSLSDFHPLKKEDVLHFIDCYLEPIVNALTAVKSDMGY